MREMRNCSWYQSPLELAGTVFEYMPGPFACQIDISIWAEYPRSRIWFAGKPDPRRLVAVKLPSLHGRSRKPRVVSSSECCAGALIHRSFHLLPVVSFQAAGRFPFMETSGSSFFEDEELRDLLQSIKLK